MEQLFIQTKRETKLEPLFKLPETRSWIDLDQITILNLSNNDLKRVPDEIFELKNLENLDLSSNLIKDLPIRFKKNLKLQKLNLSGNTDLKFSLDFLEMPCLQELDISFINLAHVPNCLLNMISLLSKLDISNNSLVEFDIKPKFISTLKVFDISHNKLTRAPRWFTECDCVLNFINISFNLFNFGTQIILKTTSSLKFTLKNFYLKNCLISFNDLQFIKEIKNLKILDVSNEECKINNCISSEMDDIEIFSSVKELNISRNYIGNLPKTFGALKNLTRLTLSNNFLSTLPETFIDLINLELLDLSFNELVLLPENIEKLRKLKNLYLCSNCLCKLPDSIIKLEFLEVLDLYDNQFEEFQFEILENFLNLTGFDIGFNLFNKKNSTCEDLKKQLRDDAWKNGFDNRVRLDEVKILLEEDETDHDISDHDCLSLKAAEEVEDVEVESWDVDKNVDDDFDPYDERFFNYKRLFKRKFMYKDNYCPARDHAPSFLKLFKNKPEFISVEGQFDPVD